jgi:glycosyltransferase involved in cell wall biosynthesis
MPVNFLIIVPGYNCSEFVAPCLRSIKKQTVNNYRVVVINDGSTDKTLKEINKFDFNVMSFNHNHGAAFCRHAAITAYGKDEDVIVLLDLDDELKQDALETIIPFYENGVWMTYGNWVNQNGQGLPDWFQLEFDDDTHQNRSYRQVKYRATHLKTFKKFLIDRIPVEDFKINGKWMDTTTESELMFSCLEMCGKDRIGVVQKPIYIYNQYFGNVSRRLGQGYKNEIYAQVIKRIKKPLYEDTECLPG